jgi:hypothetical protein
MTYSIESNRIVELLRRNRMISNPSNNSLSFGLFDYQLICLEGRRGLYEERDENLLESFDGNPSGGEDERAPTQKV